MNRSQTSSTSCIRFLLLARISENTYTHAQHTRGRGFSMPSMRKPRDTRNWPDRRAAATNRPHTNAIDRTAEAAATNRPHNSASDLLAPLSRCRPHRLRIALGRPLVPKAPRLRKESLEPSKSSCPGLPMARHDPRSDTPGPAPIRCKECMCFLVNSDLGGLGRSPSLHSAAGAIFRF